MTAVYGFRRSATGRISARMDEVERGLLRSLAEQVIALVAPESVGDDVDPLETLVGISPDAQMPEDPALARLLPDAYRDDPEAAAEFRRFTDRSLREAKVANARSVLSDLAKSGEKVRLTSQSAPAWLTFLNDARLTLGVRIGVQEDNHAELANLPEGDPRAGLFHVYDWLTFLQESLVQAVLPNNN